MSQVATETLRGIPEIRRFFRTQHLAMLDDPSTTPERTVDYLWLGASWSHSLRTFEPSTHVEALVEASVA
jgi:hypothetical protein